MKGLRVRQNIIGSVYTAQGRARWAFAPPPRLCRFLVLYSIALRIFFTFVNFLILLFTFFTFVSFSRALFQIMKKKNNLFPGFVFLWTPPAHYVLRTYSAGSSVEESRLQISELSDSGQKLCKLSHFLNI